MTIHIKPKKLNEAVATSFRMGGEFVLKQFAEGGLKTHDAQELYSYSQHEKFNWPNAKVIFNGEETQIDILQSDTTLLQEVVTAKKDKKCPTSLKMKDIMSYLDENVIGQTKAKRDCVRLVKHHIELNFGKTVNGVKLRKKNALIHGPSGCGKTEIWRRLSEITGIPVIIVDASSLSPTDYKGKNTDELARDIWLRCGKDIEKAGSVILVLDEWDKIGGNDPDSTVRRFRQSLINDLLTFIEGGLVPFKENQISPDTHYLDTHNITVVAMGAFEGIEGLFSQQGSVGFGAERLTTATPDRNSIADKIDVKALSHWSFNMQILGRFPIRSYVLELTEDELIRIQLDVPNSIYYQWQELFARLDNNVELSITKPAIEQIAKNAIANKTGARELDAQYHELLCNVYDDAEFDENIKSVKVVKRSESFEIETSNHINTIDDIFTSVEEA